MTKATTKKKAPEKEEGPGRKELLRQAYGTASQELREEHRDEFNERYAAAAQRLGVDWSPRPSEEQKAEQTFQQLLTDYPHLRDRLSDEPEDQPEDESDDSAEEPDEEPAEEPDKG